jgi:hypothetical protein
VVFTDLAFDAAIREHGTESEQRDLAVASGTDPRFRAFNPAWIATALPHLVDGGLLGALVNIGFVTHGLEWSVSIPATNLVIEAQTGTASSPLIT